LARLEKKTVAVKHRHAALKALLTSCLAVLTSMILNDLETLK